MPAVVMEDKELHSKEEEGDLMYTLLKTRDTHVLETHVKMLIGFFNQKYPTAIGDRSLDYDRWKVGSVHRMYIQFLFLFGLISCEAWKNYVGKHSPYRFFDPLLDRIRNGIEYATLQKTEKGKPTEGHFYLFVHSQCMAYFGRMDPYGKADEFQRNGFKPTTINTASILSTASTLSTASSAAAANKQRTT